MAHYEMTISGHICDDCADILESEEVKELVVDELRDGGWTPEKCIKCGEAMDVSTEN